MDLVMKRVGIFAFILLAGSLFSHEHISHQHFQNLFDQARSNDEVAETSIGLDLPNSQNPSDVKQLQSSEQESYFKLPESTPSAEEPQIPQENFSLFFEPYYRTTLFSQVLTTVLSIEKHMGESVEKDEAIIILDNIVYKAKFERGQALLAKAQTELLAKQQLFNDNVASLFDLKAAEANVAQAIFELQAAKKEYDACIVNVPYNGKVVTILVEAGELVQVGQTLGQAIYDEKLIGKLLVPPVWLNKIHLGQSMQLRVNETGTNIEGKIIRIDAVMDPSSSLTRVDILIENEDGLFRAGMSATTSLREGTGQTPSAK